MSNFVKPQMASALGNLNTDHQGQPSSDESYNLALSIVQAADERKGSDITLLRVADVSYLADYFVVVTGLSNPQVRAIARSIEDKVEEDWQRLPVRSEGQAEGSWILLDYGDVIAHIFLPREREFYNLEAFWGHAERMNFSLSHPTGDSLK